MAEPTDRNTPNPDMVTKLPLPSKPKLRPCPDTTSDPRVTFAPTDWNETSMFDVPAAPVSSWKLLAVRVTKLPSLTDSVLTAIWKESATPCENVTPIRNAWPGSVPVAVGVAPAACGV